jgi:hypothetical protein
MAMAIPWREGEKYIGPVPGPSTTAPATAIMPTKALVDDEGHVVDHPPPAAAVGGSSAQARPPPLDRDHPPPRRRNARSSNNNSSNNLGTSTYTLAQALDVAASRKRSQTSLAAARGTVAGASAPIDVLVAIVSLSADHLYVHAGTGTGTAATATAAGRGPTAELLVTDPSLPLGCCARIRLYGREHTKQLSGIGRGDVVRFNRIDVSKDDRTCAGGGDTSTRTCAKRTGTAISSGLSTVVCDMRPSWSDPEAGVPFARVGIGAPAHYGCNGNDIVVGDDNTCEVVDPHTLPNAMMTSPSAVEELLSWFQKHYSSSSNGGGAVSSFTAAGVGPCRRRKLRDITNPNLLSDVVVNVVHCDADVILSPAAVLSLRGGANSKRRLNVISVPQQRGCVATLADGSEAADTIPLYECHRFRAILESSTGRSQLLITNVLSRRLAASSASTLASCLSSMILLPTPNTTISSMSDDSLAASTAAGPGSALSSQFWDSQSQRLIDSPGQGPRSPLGNGMTEEYDTKTAMSQILDIFVDDCNQCLSDEQILADPDKLASILVTSCRNTSKGAATQKSSTSQYRNTTITIDFVSAGRESFVVKASGTIMEALCCSCPASDLMEGKDAVVLRRHVRDLLRGFIHLNVPLEWTLQKKKERETGQWTVVDATLPRIDLRDIRST